MSERDSTTPKKKAVDPGLEAVVKHEFSQAVRMCPPKQEPVLTILRAHLLAEHYIERAITARLPRGDRVIEAGLLGFAQKVNLLEGLNLLSDELVQSLKGLNRVRNSCAHEMERAITIPDVERIGRPLGAEFTSLRRKHFDDVRKLLHEVIMCIARELSGSVYYLEKRVADGFDKIDPVPEKS